MTTKEGTLPGWQRTLSRWIPLDVVLAWALGIVAATAVVAGTDGFLRAVLATPLLFVLPGYVLVATLFPQRDLPALEGPAMFGDQDRVGLRERLALSFGLSVALLPLLGVALAISPWSIAAGPMLGVLLAFVGVVGVAAALRRRQLPEHVRFHLPVHRWIEEGRRALGEGATIDRALNVALLATVLLALGTAGFAIAVPQDGEQFTDVAVLTEDGGELVAHDYPDEVAAGQSAELVTAVENYEGQQHTYHVVVELERPADGATAEVTRFDRSLAPGERWTEQHQVTPELTGERLRLHYYVYRDGVPEQVGPETADGHVWLSLGQ